MGPAYRYGEPCSHPYPPYYWAQPNVARPRPILTRMPEPYYYNKESPGNYYWSPHEWSYNYGGGPYWHSPDYTEYEFSRPKFNNYEGDGRDFRYHTYIPPQSPYVDTRPFNPKEQFRLPDDYPMRFVPAIGYDRFGPYHPQQHCCGCPNHVCHPKPVERMIDEPADEKRIKDSKDIDGKKMMDICEKKWSDNLQELPEPIVWIPGSLSDRNEEKCPVYWVPWNRKSTESGRERPFPGYGVPLDSNTGLHDRKNEDENGKSPPFPSFWIPTRSTGEGDSKVQNPLQETKKADGGETAKENENIDGKPTEKKKEKAAAREIPVKQQEEEGKPSQAQKIIERDLNVSDNHHVKKASSTPAEQKKEKGAAREIPVKQLEEEGKPSQAQKIEEQDLNVSDNHHVKKATSPRPSKLPPVCLRVDPLPRKKSNGTSSSRSPSPPRNVEESKDNVAVKAEENANFSASKVDSETKKAKQQSSIQGKEAEVKKNTQIGPDQAALRIQALYRGYQVRKFQPLKKLREIMKIRGRVEELRQQMLSPESVRELSRDSKARGRFNETLMGLLLQLDTIQGLHPVVRDVRKSVARELLTMQEKVDKLVEEACANTLQEASRDTAESDKTAAAATMKKPVSTSEVTEISGDTLLKTSSNNQQTESGDKATVGENVENTGSLKMEVLEVENESEKATVGENVENTGSLKEEEVLEVENKATEDGEDVNEKAPIKKDVFKVKNEATKDGDDLEKAPSKLEGILYATSKDATSKDGKYEEEKVETVNQDKDGTEEKDSAMLAAEVTDDNITLEDGNELGFSNVRSNVENLLDTALLKEEDIVNEKLPSATLEQEQGIVDIENEKLLNSALPNEEVVNEKLSSMTMEQEQAVVDIENERLLDLALPKEEDVVNEKPSSVALEQEQPIEGMEYVNALDEKPAVGSQDNTIVNAVEAEIDQDKIAEKCTAPVSDRNEDEREVNRALTEETECHDNEQVEFTAEVPSQMISPATEEISLARMEEKLPSNEIADGEEEPTTAVETQTIGKPVGTVNTVQADLRVQNEEDLAAKEELSHPALEQPAEGRESTVRCGEILQKTEHSMADMEDKPSIESKSLVDNKAEDAYVVDTNESESKMMPCEGKQDHEKWKEENEKLKEMVEKLLAAGKLQMSTIVQLDDKLKQLENKLSQGKAKRKVRAGPLKSKNNVMSANRRKSTALGT